MANYSPIVLFVYNRLWHTQQTIKHLLKNNLSINSSLFIYSDSYVDENSKIEVLKVREYLKKIQGFKTINIIERENNFGLAKNIISGVSEIINKYGKVIVLEDDIVPKKGFLNYMNEALEMYGNDDKVGCIHAWNYNFKKNTFKNSTFFLRGADCWGWATWKNKWELLEKDGKKLLNEILGRNLDFEFDRKGTHYYTDMLIDQINGKNDSWAIRWHASLFLTGKYCLQPSRPIVKNIGLDNSGIHSKKIDIIQKTVNYISLKKIPVKDEKLFYKNYTIEKNLYNNFKSYIKKNGKKILPRKIIEAYYYILSKEKSKIIEIEWLGFYNKWEDTEKIVTGYDDIKILENCRNAIIKVRDGLAKYERDSVTFNKIEYSFGLTTALLKSSIENNNLLSILDFGGSLGSSYFQNKDILPSNIKLEWSIIEQKHFVDCGKKLFKDNTIKFYYSIEECLENRKPTVAILSSVIQYLENPFEIINKINSLDGINYIILDRTSFINHSYHKIGIQKIHNNNTSYPVWFFNEKKIVELFDNYKLMTSFDNKFTPSTTINNIDCYWKGLIFNKK